MRGSSTTATTRALAEAALAHGADLVAFGLPYIASPDLVRRPRDNPPLTSADKFAVYGGDAKGYADYPVWWEEIAAAK